MRLSSIIATLVATSAATAAPSASAALVTRNETHAAVQVCQAALPAFETAIRKRPKAIQNEGTSTVFLSCGLEGRGPEVSLFPYARRVSVYLVNVGTEEQTVTCTALEGDSGSAAVTRTQIVPAGNNQQSMQFTNNTIDPVNGYWRLPLLSCALPPGTGIGNIWYGFVEDNGV